MIGSLVRVAVVAPGAAPLPRRQAGSACRFCIGHVPVPEEVAVAELAAAGVRHIEPWRATGVPVEVICLACGHRGYPGVSGR